MEPVIRMKRQWIPPSTIVDLHEFLDIAPKVRSILNKLTPEKFQKLSNDLLDLDLCSETILKGIIFFIFDKALIEHIYSPIYARLCKRLDDEAPNFQPSGRPTTFRKLLLDKCQNEFCNGPDADDAFQTSHSTITAEEEEWRYMAKQRTLGIIKFIGELVKVEMVSESVAYHCIRCLLPKQHLNGRELECLVQFIKTCGGKLESGKSRHLMDAYFSYIKSLSESCQLIPRFRFMLLNLIDLRNNDWKPRKGVSCEGPVPIATLQMPEEKDQVITLRRDQETINEGNYSQRRTSQSSHRYRQRRRRKLRDNRNIHSNIGGLQSESEDTLGNLHNIFASQTITNQTDETSDSHRHIPESPGKDTL